MFDVIDQLSFTIPQCGISEMTYRNWDESFGPDNNDTRVYRILGGGGGYTCCGVAGELRPGWYYLLPAQCPLEFHTRDRIRLSWAHLDLWWRREIRLFNLVTPHAVEIPCLDAEFDRRFDRIPEQLNASGAGRLTALGTMYEMLGYFWQAADFSVPDGRDRRFKRLSRALRLIDSQPQRNIGVGELAAAAGMGESQFFAEFKLLLGSTPARYAMLRRLERAKRMLHQSDAKLSSIAAETGFGDAFHLSKVFKREYGMSPKLYRQSPPPFQP